MAAETVNCEQCGGAAVVKATLPEEKGGKESQEPRHLIYCPRCGMRSQPIQPDPPA
jgi:hypothetical protein